MQTTENELDLLQLIGLPEPATVEIYDHSPLVTVICQLRFNPVLSVADQTFVGPFQREIKAAYPLTRVLRNVQVDLPMGFEGGELGHTVTAPRWQFSDRDVNWSVVLAQDFMALETRSYSHFADFLGRFQTVLSALSNHIEPELWTRIGLRFINEIRLNDRPSNEIVAPELLGFLGEARLTGRAVQVQSIQQLAFRYPGGFGVNIHHGQLPLGTTVQPRPDEAPPQDAFYLLDFDVFRESVEKGGEPVDTDRLCTQLEQFDKVAYALFRRSVREQYSSTLGGHPREE